MVKHHKRWAVAAMVLVLLLLCIGASCVLANNPAVQQAMVSSYLTASATEPPTPTPTPTPTPDLTTKQGIISYTKHILANPDIWSSSNEELIGDLVKVEVSEGNGVGVNVTYYVPSRQIADNQDAKNIIRIDCFDIEWMLWHSQLSSALNYINVYIQSDLVDKYGNSSQGNMGYVFLLKKTEKKFNWDGLYARSAWDNKVYDTQWALPSIENS